MHFLRVWSGCSVFNQFDKTRAPNINRRGIYRFTDWESAATLLLILIIVSSDSSTTELGVGEMRSSRIGSWPSTCSLGKSCLTGFPAMITDSIALIARSQSRIPIKFKVIRKCVFDQSYIEWIHVREHIIWRHATRYCVLRCISVFAFFFLLNSSFTRHKVQEKTFFQHLNSYKSGVNHSKLRQLVWDLHKLLTS